MFGPLNYLNLNHLKIVLVLRRFNLQPNIRERNPVVKRDPTVIIWLFNKFPTPRTPQGVQSTHHHDDLAAPSSYNFLIYAYTSNVATFLSFSTQTFLCVRFFFRYTFCSPVTFLIKLFSTFFHCFMLRHFLLMSSILLLTYNVLLRFKYKVLLYTVKRLCFHSSHVTHNLQFHQGFNRWRQWPLSWRTLVYERRTEEEGRWKSSKRGGESLLGGKECNA